MPNIFMGAMLKGSAANCGIFQLLADMTPTVFIYLCSVIYI